MGLNSTALSVDPYVLELNRYLLRESSKWSKIIQKFSIDDFNEMHEDFVVRSGGTNDLEEIEKNKSAEAEGVAPKIPSHEKTLALIRRGKDLKEIARERGMTVGTIISHLEKLKNGGYDINLKKYKPKAPDLKRIKGAFKGSKEMKLAPAHRKLRGEYTYEELRLARLFV